METATQPYPVPTYASPRSTRKQRQGVDGAMWGLICGIVGGAGSAAALAAVMGVSVVIESGEFDDGAGVFLLLAIFGGFVGAIVGGILGLVAGMLLGLFRLAQFASGVTAGICVTPPLLVAYAITQDVPVDQTSLGLTLVAAALFGTIGYFTGKAFERRLAEDAGWATTL